MLNFVKYQGTGNDFILVDNRDSSFNSHELIPKLCDRRLGIGSDGFILIQNHDTVDFEMDFYNPDGSSSFCGNGSRCAVDFARDLEIIETSATFKAYDGIHTAEIENDLITVKMAECKLPDKTENGEFIHTGSPHFVLFQKDINSLNINVLGADYQKKIDLFGPDGINVNFVSVKDKGLIFVRTYERGVNNETLSCGTGVTASAICYGLSEGVNAVNVETKGGDLKVTFESNGLLLNSIFLTGPVEKVYQGSIQI
jgi:diaminopimelate epimerase